jgi:hypothetical protein
MDTGLFVMYYVVGSISLLGAGYATYVIARTGMYSMATKLILVLHGSLLLENIATLPVIYTGNDGLCQFMGFVRIFCGFVNVIVIFFLILVYRYWFVPDSWKIVPFIEKHSTKVVFGASLLTVLPFINNQYGQSHGHWCALRGESPHEVSFALFYFIVILTITIVNFVLTSHTIFTVYMYSKEFVSRMFSSVGFYVIVSSLSWIPYAMILLNEVYYDPAFITPYVVGILYTLILFLEKESLQRYEKDLELRTAGATSVTSKRHTAMLKRMTKPNNGNDEVLGEISKDELENILMFSWDRMSSEGGGFAFRADKSNGSPTPLGNDDKKATNPSETVTTTNPIFSKAEV